MYRQSVSPVICTRYADHVLGVISGDDTTSLTLAPRLHLIGAAGLAFTASTALADFTAAEAAFSGYGVDTPSVSGPVNPAPNTQGLLMEGTYIGSVTTPFVSDTVTGYYLVTGTDWVQAELFAAGSEVSIGAPGDFLSLAVVLPISLLPRAQ